MAMSYFNAIFAEHAYIRTVYNVLHASFHMIHVLKGYNIETMYVSTTEYIRSLKFSKSPEQATYKHTH